MNHILRAHVAKRLVLPLAALGKGTPAGGQGHPEKLSDLFVRISGRVSHRPAPYHSHRTPEESNQKTSTRDED